MKITVKELLGLPAMKKAELIAGEEGLDRSITSVNIMEVPDIARFIKGHELLLTTTYPIKDDQTAQRNLIHNLVKANVAALAIKPAFYGNEVPAVMVEMANALHFPLIRLPADASFNEILNPVLGEILNRQAVILRRNEETHQALMSIVLGGGGLLEVAQMLATLEGYPVGVHSANWRLLVYCVPSGSETMFAEPRHGELRQAAAQLNMSSSPGLTATGRGRIEHNCKTDCFAVHPVTVAREILAYLTVWLGTDPLAEYNVTTIEQAATVVALEVTKLRAVATVEQRFRSYFIEDIIQGRVDARTDAISRGAAYGWDLTVRFLPVLIELDDFRRFYRTSESSPAQVLRRLWQAVSVSAAVFATDCIVVDRGTRILALLRNDPVNGEGRVVLAARNLTKMINDELGAAEALSASVGVGRMLENILDLRLALEQATLALEIGQIINGTGSITHFDELGFYRVLFMSRDNQELTAFSEDLLKPLQDSDRHKRTDLVRTLEAILKCNGNLRQAAGELYVHYNTLRYRVSRIEELTKLDVGSYQGSFNFHMALMIQRMNRHRAQSKS
ncbi:MAG: PucR family transcriptional regulator ligand-binding domain-containing protein [Thermaerobacter sp.]|nr:PucR family transcriptional regulator ligand-binding domain-containing protein [Thermaerobacter sp.]